MANLVNPSYHLRMEKRYPCVTSYLDRHGKMRWRFRQKGKRPHHFKSDYGTPGFAAEYEWATSQKNDQPPQPKPERKVSPIPLRRMAGVELIYFAAADRGPIKIGRTANIASRFLRLQTGHAKPLRLLAAMPGDAAVERELHERFADQRVHGEWFARCAELKALIRANPVAWWRTEIQFATFHGKKP